MDNISRLVEGIEFNEHNKYILVQFTQNEVREKLGSQCYNLIIELVEGSNNNTKLVIINMSSVELITSSPLGKLNMLLKHLENKGIRLILCGIENEVLKIFQLMQLTRVFNIVNEKEALAIANKL